MKVAAGEGHEEAADQMLNDDVFNRTDDYLPPDRPAREDGRRGREAAAGAHRDDPDNA